MQQMQQKTNSMTTMIMIQQMVMGLNTVSMRSTSTNKRSFQDTFVDNDDDYKYEIHVLN